MEVIGGRFEIVSRVATGGMGVVYQATDTTTGAVVALKLITTGDHDSRLRFDREATILATLRHPGIVRYVAHGLTHDGNPFLVMDWIPGETLHHRLETTGVTITEAIQIGRGVGAALGHAHARGVVHRDIKPGNIILRGPELDDLVIVDFGVARAVSSSVTMTRTGDLIGTPGYMSPEQARGDRDVDARADVFALGCVLYECVARRRAFEGRHVLALIAKVTLWEPPPISALVPAVPPDLEALIVTMIAKQPSTRPADGAAVASQLAQLDGEPVRPLLASAPVRTPANDQGPPTLARRTTSIVVATTPVAAAGDGPVLPFDDLAQVRERLQTIAAAPGVVIEVVRDGAIVAIVAGLEPGPQIVHRAIECARAVRAAHPERLVAISTGTVSGADASRALVERLLEATSRALAAEAMAEVFAGPGPAGRPVGAIRLDDATAELLDRAPMVRIRGIAYLEPTG